MVVNGGAFNAGGNYTVNVAGTPTAGTYDLINYTGSTAAVGGGFLVQPSSSGVFNYSISLNTSTDQYDLIVSSNLTWTGATSSAWDTTTSNWANTNSSPAASVYADGAAVTFADQNPINSSNVTNTDVVIQSAGVKPASLTFTNSGASHGGVDYTIDSTGSSVGIGGSTGLTLTGTGSVTLLGANTYTSTTALNAGTLIVSNNNSLGAASAPITFNGGTLRYASGSSNTDISSRTVTISSGGATIDLNGNNVSFANPIGNGGSGGLTVADSGSAATLTLSAANTYIGPINLNGGTVRFSSLASLGAGSAVNFGGGTLQWAPGNIADISGRTLTIGAGRCNARHQRQQRHAWQRVRRQRRTDARQQRRAGYIDPFRIEFV